MHSHQKWKFLSILLVFIMLTMGIVVSKQSLEPAYSDSYLLDINNLYDHLWSPDGQYIAYTTCPTGQSWNCDLWVSDYRFDSPQLIYTGVQGSQLYDWQGDWLLIGLQPVNPAVLMPDGQAIANELWKIHPDGTDLTRLTSTYTNGIRTIFANPYWGDAGTVGWAKYVPGTELVYFSAHDGNGWWGPHLTTTDGSDSWTRIMPYSYSFSIGMSPSGDKLVWGSASYYNLPTTLYTSKGDGSEGYSIYSLPVKSSPLVLGDSYTIILSWTDGEIHAINIDGTGLRTIIADEYINNWESYHPLQDHAFLMTSNRVDDGNYHVFKVVETSTGVDFYQMTDGAYQDQSPMYSPDGHYLLYRRIAADFVPTSTDPTSYQLVVKDMVPVETECLINTILGYLNDGLLNKGQTNALVTKIQHVLSQYMKGHMKTASNTLNAFIHQITDYVDNGTLTAADGGNLLIMATMISTMIG